MEIFKLRGYSNNGDIRIMEIFKLWGDIQIMGINLNYGDIQIMGSEIRKKVNSIVKLDGYFFNSALLQS